MRTSLVYTVSKEEEYNYDTGKYERHIKSRGFEFYVSGAKTEQEHTKIINSFQNCLQKNGIQADAFGSGTWAEALSYGTEGQKDFTFIYIAIDEVEEKEDIKDLYKEWKQIGIAL